ncbi:MAG: four helix bundle protein [Phycisphaerales bacterium]|nr:MAG: four helix bundle protein [Phycisphaerales bacterium]
MDMAYGSAREVQYQLSIASRLGYLHAKDYESLQGVSTEVSKVLNGLLRAFRKK